MTRLNIAPEDVQIVIGRHVDKCGCAPAPHLIDTRCVEAYYVEIAEPPQLGTLATREDSLDQAIELAQAGDTALIEGDHAEATAHYAGASAWAALHPLLAETEPFPSGVADTAVIPRVEPGQGADPVGWCNCPVRPFGHPRRDGECL